MRRWRWTGWLLLAEPAGEGAAAAQGGATGLQGGAAGGARAALWYAHHHAPGAGALAGLEPHGAHLHLRFSGGRAGDRLRQRPPGGRRAGAVRGRGAVHRGGGGRRGLHADPAALAHGAPGLRVRGDARGAAGAATRRVRSDSPTRHGGRGRGGAAGHAASRLAAAARHAGRSLSYSAGPSWAMTTWRTRSLRKYWPSR